MKLVVDIPEEYYKAIKEIPVEQSTADMLIMRYGTPLPKGHGRLVDYDEMKKIANCYGEYTATILSHIKPQVIIEADGGDAE